MNNISMPTVATTGPVSTEDNFNVQNTTPERVEQCIQDARSSHGASKSAAAAAAAHTYLVWRDAFAPTADADMRKWARAKVSARNTEIAEINDKLNARKTQAKAFAAGKLSPDHWIYADHVNEEGLKKREDEKARLAADAKLTNSDWNALRKVSIEARGGASQFVEVVKYALGFDAANQSALVSRYAMTLDWIHDKFRADVVNAADSIADAIIVAGGVEEVLRIQRGKNAPSKDAKAAIAKAAAANAKWAIDDADIKAETILPGGEADGLVALLARRVGERLEIVGDIEIAADDYWPWIKRFDDDIQLPTDEGVELLFRLLEIGELVSEGKLSDKTVGNNTSGSKIAEERVVWLVTATNATELVVSARYADSSVVIKCRPAADVVAHGGSCGTFSLSRDTRRDAEWLLREPMARTVVKLDTESLTDEPVWTLVNTALLDANFDGHSKTLSWEPLTASTEHKPLDIDGFKPTMTVTVAKAAFADLYKQHLAVWSAVKAANDKEAKGKGVKSKIAKDANLRFVGKELSYVMEGYAAHVVPCDGGTPAVMASLRFRASDLHDLVQRLCDIDVASFTVAADEAGLLCVGWTDRFGSFDIYLPTVNSYNHLETRRIAPMRIAH
jgi:hypothetical protein